jgi:hypothetical protein
MGLRAVRLAVKLAGAIVLAAILAGCGRDEIMTVKYPLIWAGMVAGGPSGEWLWGDCDEFAPPRRQAKLCELRREVTENAAEREARLARAQPASALCLGSLDRPTCHAGIVHVQPGQE